MFIWGNTVLQSFREILVTGLVPRMHCHHGAPNVIFAKSWIIEATDYTLYQSTDIINHAGCYKNTRKVAKEWSTAIIK